MGETKGGVVILISAFLSIRGCPKTLKIYVGYLQIVSLIDLLSMIGALSYHLAASSKLGQDSKSPENRSSPQLFCACNKHNFNRSSRGKIVTHGVQNDDLFTHTGAELINNYSWGRWGRDVFIFLLKFDLAN